jgi:trehalose-6-phosphate synthase
MTEDWPEYVLKEEEEVKDRIESKFGKDTLIFNKRSVTKEERWALMAISNIWITTPLRQGYTLVHQQLNLVLLGVYCY